MTIATRPRISDRPAIQAHRYAISSGHYLATEAGMRMFRKGGNAIDAGVAAGICIDVLLPDLCNFGGVAPSMVYDASSDELVSISGLGYWGESASREYFVNEEGGQIPIGAKRSIVPGAPDAWLTALARYGKLSFADVVQPAIELAAGGFVVYPSLHYNLAKAKDNLASWESSATVFLPNGDVPAVGSILRQADLANTFKRMMRAEERKSSGGRAAGVEAARDEFYRGDIGKTIAEFIQSEGGFVSESDLAEFASDIEYPPHTTFDGIDVFVCGPWCQGPVLAEALNILSGFDLRELGHNSADYIHLVIESLNLAFADREHFFGDPKQVYVPIDRLLSMAYAEQRRGMIDLDHAFGMKPAPGSMNEPASRRSETATAPLYREPDTSYVCAVDEDGNAFSATPSDGVGSTPIVPGLGLICSGRGSQSWLEADHPSAVAPRKRPRLTPNPAMAFRDGKLFMPFGTPGGDMQPQSMLQTFLNVVVFEMDVQQAIEQPRFGTFSFPNSFWPHAYERGRIRLETRVPDAVVEELGARGHDVQLWPEWTRIAGNVCAILVDYDQKTVTAGADARAEAYAAGW
ncbi:MAG: gamma-glutamyltransferase family protein [Chloroflexota bacterium]